MSYNTGNEDLDVKGFGYLEEKRVGELAEYLRSWNLLEASVGLAAINSVIEPKGNTEANGLDVALEIGKRKKIVMIGKFPGLQKFKEVAKEFIVLELNPFLIDPSQGILPSIAAETVIEDAQVVIITATTIINKSIDNSMRKLVQESKPSLFTGLFFSLGHSTVVILLSIALMVATRAVESSIPQLENIGSIVGTLVSGFFLYIIDFLNLVVLFEIYELFKQAKLGKLDEAKLNDALLKRGFMNRYFKGLFKIVNNQYYLYPIGFLFGLGFDTASETALLAISAGTAGVFTKIPLWTLLVFPSSLLQE
jgi:hypothetical protein